VKREKAFCKIVKADVYKDTRGCSDYTCENCPKELPKQKPQKKTFTKNINKSSKKERSRMKMVKTIITHTETKAGHEEITKKEGYFPGEPFHFSEKDKLNIFEMIREAGFLPVDDTAERYFLLYLEYFCTRFLWMQDAPKREENREKLNDAKKSFKKTIGHLENLEKEYLPWVNFRTPDPYMENYFSDAENQAVILDKLNTVKEHLSFLIKEIQKYEEPKRDKWKTSHRITTQFFSEVARILDMQFLNVKLTKYNNKKSHNFFVHFCENLLKTVNPDNKDEVMDITRARGKAIDALAEQKKKPLFWIE